MYFLGGVFYAAVDREVYFPMADYLICAIRRRRVDKLGQAAKPIVSFRRNTCRRQEHVER